MRHMLATLRQHGIQPTPQRLAVAKVVLGRDRHPSAEEVWAKVRRRCPTVSRATVYNTLNLFVDKGLLTMQVLREGTAVFDAEVRPHHHFIDERTGRIYDVPWDALQVQGQESLNHYDVRELQVVLRGRRRKE
ncbi:MAG: transcriptional repressor [Phycisphaerae bacterium]|nr:transcriptional repressor [Phycisphaerae bacterium]